MADGIYKPIRLNTIDVAPDSTLVERDSAIATALVQASNQAQHESSAVLIRVDSLARATQVQIIYRKLGLEAAILTSQVPAPDRAELMEQWRSGIQKALIVVDMLGEGIDLPNLRLVGYHDKHKSINATMQFIGRLARENPEFPQESVLTTVRDQDIYPYLQGVLRSLYDEDADWATILPGLIDDEIENSRRDAEYVAAFQQPPATLNLNSVAPLARAVLYEVPEPAENWRPDFVDGAVPDETAIGAIFASQRVAYAGINRDATQFLLVTTTPEHPDWYLGDELTHPIFDLHVVSWHASPQTNRRHVLMINTKDNGVRNALIELFDPEHILRNADPGALQDAFDSLERRSVSSVGVRNTYAAPQGTPAYAMFQGKSIEGGLRESDTSSRALGHAMAQVNTHDGQLVSAGIASAKGKYWERRHLSLREYERFCAELVGRYWSPQQTESGPLLPNVARGKRTEAFPSDPIITAELNPSLFGQGWQTSDGRLLDNLEIDAADEPPSNSDVISLRLFDPAEPNIDIWAGQQDINGHFTTTSSRTPIRRGQSGDIDFGQLAEMAAPAVYFLNGQTVMGTLTYDPIRTEDWIPGVLHFDKWNWAGVDIRSEAKLRSGAQGATIHQQVENYLCSESPTEGSERWVLHNDGSGEIADHLVIEVPTHGQPRLELWHSKYAHGAKPGLRQDDLQVVAQQAAKSRRHITDRRLWQRIARRLTGQEAPVLRILQGERTNLLAFCGIGDDIQRDFSRNPPTLRATIAVVQPGLDVSALEDLPLSERLSAGQVREYLVFLANAIQDRVAVRIIGS